MGLPNSVRFEGIIGPQRFWLIGFRKPRKGEYYLSGAFVYAYRAANDLLSPYWVVERKDKA